MTKVLFVDDEKCTGCRLCEMYCSITKSGSCNPEKARVRIVKLEKEAINVPVVCQHCHDAPCVMVCPVNAIRRDEQTGVVSLNNDVCIGCHSCIAICPFGAISLDTADSRVIKCDQCAGQPACAKNCPTGAIQFIEADRLGWKRKRQGMDKLLKLRLSDQAGGEP